MLSDGGHRKQSDKHAYYSVILEKETILINFLNPKFLNALLISNMSQVNTKKIGHVFTTLQYSMLILSSLESP